MSERKDEQTTIEVDPNITVHLHQSELFGDRYQFNLIFDKRANYRLSVEQAQKLQQALAALLEKVEE